MSRLVTAAPQPAAQSSSPAGHLVVRRKCGCEKSSDSSGECEDCQSDRFVQRTPQFGHNFSNVRVHADSQVAESVRPQQRRAIQLKLMVGRVDDPLEHEADRWADQVLRLPDADLGPIGAPAWGASKSAADASPDAVEDVLREPGRPLDPESRTFFEPRFGFDFSRVRIHADERTAQAAAGIGAQAFTAGEHVAFGRVPFALHSAAGSRLLAHELAHVVQQTGADMPVKVRRQPEKVPELDRQLKEAIEAKNWSAAAEVLNQFSKEDIEKRLAQWSRGVAGSIHARARENPKLGPESQVAISTRPAYLDLNYENEKAHLHWGAAAVFLNEFNRDDILKRLGKLTREEVQALHDGAVSQPGVGDKSQVALVTAQWLLATPATAPPPAATATTCATPYKQATSFKELIDLVRAAESKLSGAGTTSVKDQIHALCGLYYGTTWSKDYAVEKSVLRNEGFQRFTRPSEPDPTKSVPRDVTALLDCGLADALKNSQDTVDPGGRHVDFGHLLIGLDARFDPAFASKVSYPVLGGVTSVDLGGTGTELVTWLGDLGGGAASLAITRVGASGTKPIRSLQVVITAAPSTSRAMLQRSW
jgi:hypothetical protein